MRLITVMEIQGNYPENILIDAGKNDKGKFDAYMYMKRGEDIHKIMLSTNGGYFKSEKEAIDYMTNVAEDAMKVDLNNV